MWKPNPKYENSAYAEVMKGEAVLSNTSEALKEKSGGTARCNWGGSVGGLDNIPLCWSPIPRGNPSTTLIVARSQVQDPEQINPLSGRSEQPPQKSKRISFRSKVGLGRVEIPESNHSLRYSTREEQHWLA
ncbi:unnamed protein product [Ilex paraguariensis]|uniref:Uncharacterized protein n=1 Tax=Ilex paraguariensis TaxID=185542 RepID=A0ABC8TQT4_9AQUA